MKEVEESKILLCSDDKYRWLYKINLFKDTLIPLTVFKIFALSCFAPVLLLLVLSIFEGNFTRDWFMFIKVYLLLISIFTVLLLFSYYLVYIPIRGGKYFVMYELDDNNIKFIESKKNSDKMIWLNGIGIFAGLVSGNLGVAGANMISASRKQMNTKMKNVKKIVVYKSNVMKLISNDMTRNLIYYTAENKDFIINFMKNNCNQAQFVFK